MGLSAKVLGLLRAPVSFVKPVWTKCNELALRIETQPESTAAPAAGSGREWWRGPTTDLARHSDNNHYVSIDYWNIRKMVRILKPGPDDVVYDIGAGMGRVVCILARLPLRRCVGVELFEPLCQKARKNAERLRGRKSRIDIICADATTADMADGTIYFLFNPFGPETLSDTMENIRRSVAINPRSVRIAYYNSYHDLVLERAGWLRRVHHYNSFGGSPVSIWQSQIPLGD